MSVQYLQPAEISGERARIAPACVLAFMIWSIFLAGAIQNMPEADAAQRGTSVSASDLYAAHERIDREAGEWARQRDATSARP